MLYHLGDRGKQQRGGESATVEVEIRRRLAAHRLNDRREFIRLPLSKNLTLGNLTLARHFNGVTWEDWARFKQR
jgi:hypothetical protein